MSSQCFLPASLLRLTPSTRHFPSSHPPPSPPPLNPFLNAGIWCLGKQRVNLNLQCNAISKPRTEEYTEVLPNDLPVIKWDGVVEEDIEKQTQEVSTLNKIKEGVETVRSMLRSMDDGDISVSAYDTAWVALVKDINGGESPQFPTALDWIANNQLPDGSWGDRFIFLAHDRILNTLACVIALKSWDMHPEKCEQGMMFLRENMKKLGEENAEHMPIGFEVAFPSLIEMAKKLGIEFPDESPVVQDIYALRNLKLKKIPRELMHQVPTTLLHSLEGMEDLEWQKLLRLRCDDGSFLFSPASTAFALMQTKDDNCLRYLANAVRKFNGGVPNVYPVDMFEHIWAVDRLQRLGISRYIMPEIAECIDYIHRNWSDKGICWARNTRVEDIDDTAMAFRLLRLQGYEVSPDVFKNFEKGGEFFCFVGQANHAVTGMYNLYRASQLRFPGEEILNDTKNFALGFLQQKRASNELLDKWIIIKDLPGEVGYALDVPWYASLPRVETRLYLEQYGGEDDVWIGKTLYRMPIVNNNMYLEVGKLDYNYCQAIHQLEWKIIRKWYKDCNLAQYGVSERSLLLGYYLAMASIFEPERSKERLAWAKTSALIEAITTKFQDGRAEIVRDQIRAFITEFTSNVSIDDYQGNNKTREVTLVETLRETLNQLSLDALLAHGRDIHQYLHQAWGKWLLTWEKDGGMREGEAELIVRTLNLFSGRSVSEELLLSHPKHQQLMEITNRVCHRLSLFRQSKSQPLESPLENTTTEIESNMQYLVKMVLTKDSDEDLNSDVKQTFLTVTKTFYYTAYCDPGTINFHIAKVLFERVP
ncbi:(-)-kolavenyl diphosphate synthase TPS28, chloroplastic isoform X2 [Ipomoea triloba]|uniref:(-)-kolavenyl diphosphate synthase TPS28, chloroplastic isoform X2 n=1 Tax=Ipomoea triloba TaxID=35885 RepID=UPI00125DBE8B|nr:(-)-kolavenyl diphosphate synthase TPS28, chloroplastic isoform X2 [Ipomoea triloba]